jgi:hypothetical protein
MCELASFIPLFALIVSSISATIGILTYRKVSKKVFSKTKEFDYVIDGNESKAISSIDGKGLFEKLEISGEGTRDSKLLITIDSEICLNDTFNYFLNFAPQYPKYISFTKEYFTLTIDLPKSFYRNCTISVENMTGRQICVKGKIHYKIS